MSWLVFSLLSLVLLGIGNFCFRMAAGAGQSPLAATAVGYVFQAALGIIVFLALKPVLNTNGTALFWPMLAGVCIGLGILCMVFAFGKPEANAGVVATLTNANFMVVATLAWLVLGQPFSIKQLLGFAVILGGLFLII